MNETGWLSSGTYFLGDTVLVYQGRYYENLDINKTITLTSLAIYDDLDTWYEYESITSTLKSS